MISTVKQTRFQQIIQHNLQRKNQSGFHYRKIIQNLIQKKDCFASIMLQDAKFNQTDEIMKKIYDNKAIQKLNSLVEYYKFYWIFPIIADKKYFGFMEQHWIKSKANYYNKIKKMLNLHQPQDFQESQNNQLIESYSKYTSVNQILQYLQSNRKLNLQQNNCQFSNLQKKEDEKTLLFLVQTLSTCQISPVNKTFYLSKNNLKMLKHKSTIFQQNSILQVKKKKLPIKTTHHSLQKKKHVNSLEKQKIKNSTHFFYKKKQFLQKSLPHQTPYKSSTTSVLHHSKKTFYKTQSVKSPSKPIKALKQVFISQKNTIAQVQNIINFFKQKIKNDKKILLKKLIKKDQQLFNNQKIRKNIKKKN